MTDMGNLSYFLGVLATRNHSYMFLSQRKYVLDLIDRAHMSSCNPLRTIVDIQTKLDYIDPSVKDSTFYRSLSCGL